MTDPVYPYNPPTTNNVVFLSTQDLEIINQIMRDSDVDFCSVHQESGSGIGHITHVEFDYRLNGKYATVRMNINDQKDW